MSRRISGSGFSVPSIGNSLMEEMQNDIANSRSPRVIIPIMHLYLEHTLELVLKKNWGKADKILKGRPSYLQKLQLVYSLDLINDDQYEDFKNINTIRNEFVHSFKPRDKTVKKLCLKLSNHPYNEKRSWIDMYAYSSIGLMSELTEFLE